MGAREWPVGRLPVWRFVGQVSCKERVDTGLWAYHTYHEDLASPSSHTQNRVPRASLISSGIASGSAFYILHCVRRGTLTITCTGRWLGACVQPLVGSLKLVNRWAGEVELTDLELVSLAD